MKKIFLIITLLVFQTAISQDRFEKKLAKANTYFAKSERQKALDIWKKVEKKTAKSSATYGKVIRNFLYYYSQKMEYQKALDYYHKLMNFKLNGIDKNKDVGKSFLNAKYDATITMATLFKNRKEYDKALSYIEKAEKLPYHTQSIAIYAQNKIDLATWRYWIAIAQEKPNLALSYLIKRAFEYNYKAMYKHWYMDTSYSEEKDLANMIFSNIEDIKLFKEAIDKAIEEIQIDEEHQSILFSLRGVKYHIETHSNIENRLAGKLYLKNAPFYKYLHDYKSLVIRN